MLSVAISIWDGPRVFASEVDPPLALDDLQWIDPASDAVVQLLRIPSECIEAPSDPERSMLLHLGRVAFRSPMLLGGPAARGGLSCQACHPNGQRRSTFFIEGVSGLPGTVDVTSGIFSRNREDGQVNPVPIPSLVDVASKSSFGSMVPRPDLDGFVHSAIVDEFQGQVPDPIVRKGLLVYLAALRSDACPSQSDEANDLEYELRAIESAFEVLAWALEHDEPETSDFVVVALRSALGRIYQRFPDADNGRDGLVRVSRSLAQIRPLLAERPEDAAKRTREARADLAGVARVLRLQAGDSYYDTDFLRRALGAVADERDPARPSGPQ